MNQTGKRLLMTGAACVAAAGLAGIYAANQPKTQSGSKSYEVKIIHKDGTEKTYQYSTDSEYLGEALLEQGLIKGSDGTYGLYVDTVDGETADYDTDQAYWRLQVDDQDSQTGADSTPVTDGGSYTWIYTGAGQ